MDVTASTVYLGSVVLLFVKYVLAIVVQARERHAARQYRYPEDAAYWQGSVAADSETCQRAQSLLRNDAESQPFYLVLGAAYASLGLGSGGACAYFGGYVLSRFCHAYFMFGGRQPHRTRAFSIGVFILVLLASQLLAHSLALSLR